MILICIECASDMEEVNTDEYRCPGCGYTVEQLTIPGESDPERPDSAV